MSNKVYAPHLSRLQLGWRWQRYVSPLGISFLVCRSCLFYHITLKYQIIYSHQFHQLSYYTPHFKRELCKHHVRDHESTRHRKKYLVSSASSESTCNFSCNKLQIFYYQEIQKKKILCVLLFSYLVTLLA